MTTTDTQFLALANLILARDGESIEKVGGAHRLVGADGEVLVGDVVLEDFVAFAVGFAPEMGGRA